MHTRSFAQLGSITVPEKVRPWESGDEFPYSSSQVKRAGDRIRRAAEHGDQPSDDDRALLNAFRASHYPALRHLQERLIRLFHKKRQLDPQTVPITARPLKTPEAITAKLIRERTRLNRIQDIAGARLVVPNLDVQASAERVIMESLAGLEPRVSKDTCREADEHGYRALHVVVNIRTAGIGDRPAEIQIRTEGQDIWAQLVERVDGMLESDLKHGTGPDNFREWLLAMSEVIADNELGKTTTIKLPPMPQLPGESGKTVK